MSHNPIWTWLFQFFKNCRFSGAPIGAWKAEQVGLVDHVVEVPKGEHQLNFLKQPAVYFGQSIMGKPFESRRVRHHPCEPLDDFYFDTVELTYVFF